jgi:outer membrane biosynthesis protein TonB
MIHFSFSTEDLTASELVALKAFANALVPTSKAGTGVCAEKAEEPKAEAEEPKAEAEEPKAEAEAEEPKAEPEKPKRTRRTKAQIEADKKAEEAKAATDAEPDDADGADEDDDADVLGVDEDDPIKQAIDRATALAHNKQAAVVRAALEDVGEKRVGQIKDRAVAVKFLAALDKHEA